MCWSESKGVTCRRGVLVSFFLNPLLGQVLTRGSPGHASLTRTLLSQSTHIRYIWAQPPCCQKQIGRALPLLPAYIYICIYIYTCLYVLCMYVCIMYVLCMYVCMYVGR